MSMLYYGLVVVGTAAIVLALYNLLVVKFCLEFTDYRSRQRAGGQIPGGISGWRFHESVSSFKYKREGGDVDGDGDSECAVCLSVFEEGEEVKQLPRCGHCFHASCIDMWLHSHVDCPLCRTPVVEPTVIHGVPAVQQRDIVEQSEHSREGLLGSAYLV